MDKNLFYPALAAAAIFFLGLYIAGIPKIGFSPDSRIWCGSDDAQRDRIYKNLLQAYNQCIEDLDPDGGLNLCAALMRCNEENPYTCIEDCSFQRNMLNGRKNFCESLKGKIDEFVKECYKDSDLLVPELPECKDSCLAED